MALSVPSIFVTNLSTPAARVLVTSEITPYTFVPEVSRTDGACQLQACTPPSDFDYELPAVDGDAVVDSDGSDTSGGGSGDDTLSGGGGE